MEAIRKPQEQLLSLYQHRLQNLSEVLAGLHSLVASDEIASSFADPALQKYKVDRINELVAEVLNSEKEKMLIRVLEKYEEATAKLKYSLLNSGTNKLTRGRKTIVGRPGSRRRRSCSC
jgi:hypothetical protein